MRLYDRNYLKNVIRLMTVIVENAHTESMQKNSPVLPLLLGKDVFWKLMDGCKRSTKIHRNDTNFICNVHPIIANVS